MIKIIIKYFTFFLTLILLAACSELSTDIPSVPEINTHGDSVYSAASPNYHPKTIAGSPNGMFDCQECHASDYSGGITEVGCNTTNCHPTIGVHVNGIVDPSSEDFHPKYLNINNTPMSSCSGCHGSDFSGGFASPSCANCHPSIDVHVIGILDPASDNFHGNYIKNNQWEMRTCQPCHGENYSGGLVSPTCLDCHSYPGGPENCTTCHGSSTSNAPPQDLDGNTSTSERGVGAHQVHLKGNSEGKTLTCTECHNVPGGVYTPGHVDSGLPAEVLMNNPRANLVTNDPSTSEYDPTLPLFVPDPVYNSTSLTCTNTYCHGYFKNGNLDNAPVWTNPASAVCGTCHGDGTSPLPKTESEGGSHPDDADCSDCHNGVVDENLNFINPSKHIDGLLNLFGDDIVY
jgi:predicted CxxxxCH...CXXCH cytochrome family protein